MKTTLRLSASTAALCFFLAPFLKGQDSSVNWPQEIEIPGGAVVIYQPQSDELVGTTLSGRSAVSIELESLDAPVFGAVWFEATLLTDRSDRTATITDVSITNMRFPGQDDEKEQTLRGILEREIPAWNLVISLDELIASLEAQNQRVEEVGKIDTSPPEIIFTEEPAMLILIDGEPHLVEVEDSGVKRVVNTAFSLLYDTVNETYYLYADKNFWYTSRDVMGDWMLADAVPQSISKLAPQDEAEPEDEAVPEDDVVEGEPTEPGPPPRIIVRTEPAELIVSEGRPEFQPIVGTDLLYVSNTESDVLMDIDDQKYYVLLSGRWYESPSLSGPWTYVPGDEVPDDFAKIPDGSEMATVLYAVPESDAAKEAVMDAQIPQTAAIDRSEASLNVEYDGQPKFESIETTTLTYAVNTATPVIQVGSTYYACDSAVWFVSNQPTGPWAVATSVPAAVYTIPVDSPVYNVTYVKVYKVEPKVVYVGYTSGYTNTYVYHNTVVYGTGYYYPGWSGHYYYPRSATYGFHVRYNSYSGWSFGFSYSSGPFRFTIGGGSWYRGGWWGPAPYHGYRHGYRHGYGHGYRHGAAAGYRAGYRAGQRNKARDNLYRQPRNAARTVPETRPAGNRTKTAQVAQRPNNVYADRNGNVHRKTDQGWQSRSGNQWQNNSAATQRPSNTLSGSAAQSGSSYSRSNQPTTSQLNRSYQSRQTGAQRTQSYNRSSGRSGGAGRSGGRRN